MRRLMGLFMVSTLLAAGVGPAGAQQKSTLDKIGETGTLTIGTRTGSPPFGYVNAKNEWVGFSIDLVEELIKPALEKKLGKTIKVEKKESTPPTRIPLLSSGAVAIKAILRPARSARSSTEFAACIRRGQSPADAQPLSIRAPRALVPDEPPVRLMKPKLPEPSGEPLFLWCW